MSLKAFHIAFIFCATALSMGFGAWSVMHYLEGAQASFLVMGAGSLLVSLALVWYGPWFLKKYRKLSFL